MPIRVKILLFVILVGLGTGRNYLAAVVMTVERLADQPLARGAIGSMVYLSGTTA